jgi:transcriptional regulator with GAF, ATPase, and Fis domain
MVDPGSRDAYNPNVVDEPARFEAFLLNLAARFTDLPAAGIDEEINTTLGQIVESMVTDRASVMEFTPDAGSATVTHAWARPGTEFRPGERDITRAFPWFFDRLARGETIALAHLPDDLPPDAGIEREYVRQTGFRSILTVPLTVGGQSVCALSTGTFRLYHAWPLSLIARFRLTGQILAGAIARKRAEEQLRRRLDEIADLKSRLESENVYLREELKSTHDFDQIVGQSHTLRHLLAQVALVADTDATVLLVGETGTGKELLANAIHERSRRRSRALVNVNCAAIPPALLESELFGHDKGAFTGATAARPGRFELAHGGTIFLDEVGELGQEAQAKILRVLQDGSFERLGSTYTRRVDVRVIAATNRDLPKAIADGHFREDLFYRLSGFPLHVPPLRERREDIPLLVWACIDRRQGQLGRRIEKIPERTMRALVAYGWPGNVRELQNVIERALILSAGSTLRTEDLALPARKPDGAPAAPLRALDDVERDHIRAVLEHCGWRINGPGHAAEVLGLHPNTLRFRMKRLGITRPAPRT